MGVAWGSLAGGVAEGLSGGADIAEKYQRLNEVARQRAARKALGRTYASGIGIGDGATPAIAAGPQPPMPGQASVPAMPDAPRSDDYSAMAAMAPAGTPQPPVANDDYGAMAAPQEGPAPPISSVAPSADAATPVPVNAGDEDPQQHLLTFAQDTNNTIRDISAAIKRANPNIDPEALFDATEAHIKQMAGMRSEARDFANAQIAIARGEYSTQNARTRAQAVLEAAAKAADARKYGADRGVDRANIAGKARTDSASIAADARVKASINAAAATIGAANIRKAAGDQQIRDRIEGMLEGAAIRAGATADQARTAAKARVESAIALAGGTPDRTVAPMPASPLKPLAAPGAAPAPAPAAARAAGALPAQAAAALKEGVNTTFGNGQVWTKRAGVPQRVK